jgi:hypothetical protein
MTCPWAELRPPSEQVRQLVSNAVAETRQAHLTSNEEGPAHLRVDITTDAWLLLHETACEVVGLSDAELLARMAELDSEDIPGEDYLGRNERAYMGSLARTLQERKGYYLLGQASNTAESLAMAGLREDLAIRRLRLTYLSRLSTEAYGQRYRNYELITIASLARIVVSSVWLRLSPVQTPA